MKRWKWKRQKQRFLSLLFVAALAGTTCIPAMAAETPDGGVKAAETSDTKEITSIDFSTMENLESLNGWTVSAGGGTATLEKDGGQNVLKLVKPNGGTTELSYTGLNISENDYRYVSVETQMKLGSETHANQFSIPYILDKNGGVAYTLLTEGDWTSYKSHVNGTNKKTVGIATPGTWQSIRMDIDLKEDTFRVSVDGVYAFDGERQAARGKTDNLNKIRYYADSWNQGTLYVKSVKVTAQKEHTAAASYYVSNNGNDDADGKTPQTAWKTLNRVNREYFIPGDQILFEKGGKWENQTLQPQGSGTNGNMITIGSYGTGDLPIIAANGKAPDAIYLFNQQYWEIKELEVSNTAEGFSMATSGNGEKPDSNNTARNDEDGKKLGDFRGIHITGRDVASLKGFQIHNIYVHDVTGIASWIGKNSVQDPGVVSPMGLDGSKRTGGILFECLKPTGSQPTQFSDITIEDSQFINNSFAGIAVKQWNGSGDQYAGNPGWANRGSNNGAPDYYSSRWKPHSNIIIRNNYINQGKSAYACNGLYLTSVKDSLVEKNTLEHIGVCGIELYFADNVVVQYNEVSDVLSKCGAADSNAIDPDWMATNTLIQYNYVHDCGEGFLLCGVAYCSGIIRYNLVQDCKYSYVHYSMGGGYFQLHNNVFYRSASGNGTGNFDPWGADSGRVSYFNNVFYDGKKTGFGYKGNTAFAYHNNAYYGTAAPSKETNPIILTEDPFEGTAPSMSRMGNFETGVLLEANGLRPKETSPLIAAGVKSGTDGIDFNEGLKAKGSKLNLTSIVSMNKSSWGNCVPIDVTDYPTFKDTSSTENIKLTNENMDQKAVTAENPTIGMFEVEMDQNAVMLRGTVADETGSPLADAEVTVKVGDQTVTTTANSAGSYLITEGLAAGEATITAGKGEAKVTLEAGKMNTGNVVIPLVPMPDAYEYTILNEQFGSQPTDAFNFNKGSAIENGQLVITKNMGSYTSAVADFSPQVSNQKGVDFTFEWKCDKGNKSGFEFRDSYNRLLFAVCAAGNSNQLRTSTEGDAVDGDKAGLDKTGEPKWSPNTLKVGTTYIFRVHADFAAKTVSFRVSEKDGNVLTQKLNVPTDAVNLAKMNACSWYESKPQYIDNFVITAPKETIDLPLAGKTIYAFGDSIVAGHKYEKASFVNFAASQEGMTVTKYAVNGATVMDANYSGGQIISQLDKATGNAPDYVVFDGGTNDAEYLKNNSNIGLGSVSASKDTPLDTTTFAGCFEQTIVKMQEKWPQAQLVYVAVHKLGSRDADMQEKLREIELQACAKYGVAVADVYGDSGLDTSDYNESNAYTFNENLATGLPGVNGSGTHPNLSAIEKFYMPVVTATLRNPIDSELVNKNALSAAIARTENLKEKDYTTTSWTAMQEALTAANAAMKSLTITQDEVNAATAALREAIEKLVWVDKSGLLAAIQRAGERTESDYTRESWAAMQKALSEAKTVNERGDATQKEVDDATLKLSEALRALKPVEVINKNALSAAIERTKNLKEGNYTATSWAAMQKALTAANEAMDSQTVTQEQVNEATAALREAIEGLAWVDKSGLKAAIERAEGRTEADYDREDWAAMQKALTEAKVVEANSDATQKEVDDATFKLSEALRALDPAGTVNKNALNAAIDRTKNLNEKDYTVSSWTAMQEALKAAKEAADSQTATQEQVNAATAALREALEGLVWVDKSGLQAAIERAGERTESDYTKESWAAMQKALTEAKNVDQDPDAVQTEIDDATFKLSEALRALKPAEAVTKNALSAAIDRTKNLDGNDYTATSWRAVKDALTAANEAFGSQTVTQEAVNAATAALRKALEGLVWVDKSGLKAAIQRAGERKEESYTKESWAAMQKALSDAKNVEKNGDAVQKEIDDATFKLSEALRNLVENKPAATANKEVLKKLCEDAGRYQAEDYTTESYSAFAAVKAAAEIVLKNDKATQAQVDRAAEDLEKAIKGLVEKDTIKEGQRLEKETEVGKVTVSIPADAIPDEMAAIPDKIRLNVTKQEIREAVSQMIAKITEMIQETVEEITVGQANSTILDIKLVNETNNEEVQPKEKVWVVLPRPEGYSRNLRLFHNHTDGLKELAFTWISSDELGFWTDSFSYFTLVDLGETDKSGLEHALAEAKALKAADYTAESWKALEAAVKAAEDVYADADATQEQADAAVKAIDAAMKALEKNNTKPEEPGQNTGNQNTQKPGQNTGNQNTQKPGQNTGKPNQNPAKVSPNTGSGSQAVLWVCAAVMAFGAILANAARKRSKR